MVARSPRDRALKQIEERYRTAGYVQALAPEKYMFLCCVVVLFAMAGISRLRGAGLLFFTIPLDVEWAGKFAPLDHEYCVDHYRALERFPAGRQGVLLFSVAEGLDILHPLLVRLVHATTQQLMGELPAAAGGRPLRFEDVCMRRVEVGGARGSCVQDSVFELWEAAGQEVDGIEDYHAALQQLPFGYSELAGALLAGTRYDAAGALTSAHGLLVSFAASDSASEASHAWELALLGAVEEARGALLAHGVRVDAIVARAFEDGLYHAAINDLSLIIYGCAAMVGYCCLTLGRATHRPGASQYALCLLAPVCPVLATLCAYGAMGWADQSLSPLCIFVPFLVLAVGVDDMFVLLGTLEQAPPPPSAHAPLPQGLLTLGVARAARHRRHRRHRHRRRH